MLRTHDLEIHRVKFKRGAARFITEAERHAIRLSSMWVHSLMMGVPNDVAGVEERKRVHEENEEPDSGVRRRRTSHEFSPLAIVSMAEDLGLINEDFERLPPAMSLPAASVPRVATGTDLSQLASAVQGTASRREHIETTVRRQHRAFQRAMKASLYEADCKTRLLLEASVSHEVEPRQTMHIITRLSDEQIQGLYSPVRVLVEGLRRSVKVRLDSIHAVARARIDARGKRIAASGWDRGSRVSSEW